MTPHITDDQGYNQVFKPRRAMEVRTERRAQAILDAMAAHPPADILELGSGTGELSHLLAERTGAKVVGADICLPFVRAAAEKCHQANLTFKQLDVLRPDVNEQLGQTFDYVVGNGILHHLVRQLPEVLARLKKSLKPQGRLIFWEPNLFNPYVFLIFTLPALRRWAKLDPEEMAFTCRGLAKKFHQAGFGDVQVAYRDFLVPNTPDALIGPAIALGRLAEGIPFIKNLAQSVFISAG